MELEAELPEAARQRQNVVAGCWLAVEDDRTGLIFSGNAQQFPIALSWPNLHDRVERAENVRHIFAGVGIVPLASIHDELVFVTAGRKCQPLFPQAVIRVADHAQAGWMPVVEIAADIDVFHSSAFQNKIRIVARRIRDGYFNYFIFLGRLIFHFLCRRFYIWFEGGSCHRIRQFIRLIN